MYYEACELPITTSCLKRKKHIYLYYRIYNDDIIIRFIPNNKAYPSVYSVQFHNVQSLCIPACSVPVYLCLYLY